MPVESRFILQCLTASVQPFSGVCLECQFDREQYHDSLFKQIGIDFPASLKQAVGKRKAEFLVGRYVARQSLLSMGLPSPTIHIGSHRSPVWPVGVNGSISHSGDRAFCAINTGQGSIGLDFERAISMKIANNIKGMILNTAEISICHASQVSFEKSFTLSFSAKESLFKALYPRVERYFDFLDAEIVAIDEECGHIELRLLKNLSEQIRTGQCFKGIYQWHGDGVLTLIE